MPRSFPLRTDATVSSDRRCDLMRFVRTRTEYGAGSLEATCETFLLGRLGSELALIYHDTLQAPLPSGLQTLIDRLEDPGQGSGEVADQLG